MIISGTITKKQITTWCDDCIRWATDEVKAYESQDQEWIGELLRNSCTPDLASQVDRDIEKESGSKQGGVVWAWIILHKIVYVSEDVLTALAKRIKEFGKTGLMGIQGENVMTARAEQLTFAMRLDAKKRLPPDAVDDVIQGLAKCSHVEFSKMFADFRIAQKNSLIPGTELSGTTLEQLVKLWDEAEDQYRSYTLSDQWNAGPSVHYSGTGPIKCDNCGGPHTLPHCPEPRDEARIKRNRQARLDRGGGGRGGGRGRGRGGGGRGSGSLTGRNGYQRQGKFGPPKDQELVRTINGKTHAACKICGWNTGPTMHTTGQHAKATKKGYSLQQNPQGTYR